MCVINFVVEMAVMLTCFAMAIGPKYRKRVAVFTRICILQTNNTGKKREAQKRTRQHSVNLQFAGFENNKHDNIILKRNSYSWPTVCLCCGILANTPQRSQSGAVHPKLITGGEEEG